MTGAVFRARARAGMQTWLLAAGMAAGLALASAAVFAQAESDRSGATRRSLVPLAQPLWTDLDSSQQQVLAPFAAQWNALPLSEKRAWAELASRFPKMPAEEKSRVERRIVQWAALTPEQRRLARANYRLAQAAPKEDRLAEWENYQTLTPEQRSVLETSGSTSNTAARHAGARTGLAKEASQPLPRRAPARPAPAAAPSTPEGVATSAGATGSSATVSGATVPGSTESSPGLAAPNPAAPSLVDPARPAAADAPVATPPSAAGPAALAPGVPQGNVSQ